MIHLINLACKIVSQKISARWVLQLHTDKNKHSRVIDSVAGLALFHYNPDEFLGPYITVNETWIQRCW